MLGFVAVAALGILAAAVAAWSRRRSPAPDGLTWRASPAEPWGTVVLAALLVSPAAAALGRAVGNRLVPYVLVGAFAALLWAQAGGRHHLRRFALRPEIIEWRTLRGRGSAPLEEVVAVTDPALTGEPPTILLQDGTVLVLPSDEIARTVASNLADRVGQPFLQGQDPEDPPEVGS